MSKLNEIAKKNNIPTELLKYELTRNQRYGKKWLEKIEKNIDISLENTKIEVDLENGPFEVDEIHLLVEWSDYEKEEYPKFQYEIGEILEITFYRVEWTYPYAM